MARHLLPSLREKKRYVVFEVYSAKAITKHGMINVITEQFIKCFGMFEAAKAGIIFVEQREKIGIVKISNASVDKLRASFAMLDTIDDQKVSIRSIAVSGMLRKAIAQMGG